MRVSEKWKALGRRVSARIDFVHRRLQKLAVLVVGMFSFMNGFFMLIPAYADDSLTPESTFSYVFRAFICIAVLPLLSAFTYRYLATKIPKKDDDRHGGYGPDGFVG